MPASHAELVVLLVDDNPMYLAVAVVNIERTGAELLGAKPLVLTAGSGPDALRTIAAQEKAGRPVRVLVTDADMPGQTGPELIAAVRPPLPSILITARPPAEFRAAVADLHPRPQFLPKPQRPDEYGPLVRLIREFSAFALYPQEPAAPPPVPPVRVPVPPAPVTAAGPPTPARPLPSRHLAVAYHVGTVLAVRNDLGSSEEPMTAAAGGVEFGYTQLHFSCFHQAVEAAGGQVVMLFGRLMVAVFADGEERPGVVGRACRAVADYRDRLADTLPTMDDESFAAALCHGAFQTGVFGHHLLGLPAVVGGAPDLAVQLVHLTKAGRLGWVPAWLPADGSAEIAGVFHREVSTTNVKLTGVKGLSERAEVPVV